MLLEGRHAIIEALGAGMPLSEVRIAEGVKPDRAVSEIERLAAQAGVPVRRVPRRVLDAASERGAHQGMQAQAAPFGYSTLEHVIRDTEGQSSALIVALDQVTDPGNLGAIARTTEVVGGSCVLLTDRRSAAVTPAAWKAAAGALAHVPLVRETNLARALKRLQDAGFWVAGASEKAEQDVWEAPLEGRIVLTMGSEGAGLSRLVRETCDFLVRLPQAGKVGSLNVAQATTALAYEWLRRQQAGGEA